MIKIFIWLIKLYQRISSAIFPRTCRFYPSCSQYTLEALQKHGLRKGVMKSLARIFRCSPLFRGGYDPV